MLPWVVRQVVFPLQERVKGKATYRVLRDLERTQWASADELRTLQLDRLGALLAWAHREVPYYHQLFEAHDLAPDTLAHTLEDLRRLPPLGRDTLLTRFDELSARTRPPGTQRMTTGGSTGMPLAFLTDAGRNTFSDASRLRAHRWYGVDIGSRELVLWGNNIELGRQDWARTGRDWLINSRLLSAFDMGEAALSRYADTYRRFRPEKLHAYASALYLLARYLKQQGWRPRPGWPRVAFATAEPLYDFQRALIEETLGCPVAVEYGSRDAGLVSDQCPAGGLHIHAEGIIPEIIPLPDRAGAGELVVTNLDSYAMPLIRYRTGDIAALAEGPCPCGRGLPRLAFVEGRRTDFLVTPDGRILHALAPIYVLRDEPSLREFQMVQERLDLVTVRVVAGPEFDEGVRARLAGALARLLGPGVTVEVEPTPAIARPLSGKHRYVISKVADAHLDGLLGPAPAPAAVGSEGKGAR